MSNLSAQIYRTCAEWFAKSGFGHLYPVKVVGEWVAARARAEWVDIEGMRLYLDRLDSNRISIRGYFEPFQTAITRELVNPGDTVLDIGANIGYYTVLLSRWVGESGRVYAFEPDPENFAILEKNARENGCHNVVAERLAVSDRSGPARLYREKRCHSNNSLWRSAHNDSSVEIATVRLDDYFEEREGALPSVDFIKMDVEGAEPLALRGMPRVLANSPEMRLLTEFLPIGLTSLGEDPAAYLEELARLGFHIDELDEQNGRIAPFDAKAVLARHTASTQTWTNLLCARKSPVHG